MLKNLSKRPTWQIALILWFALVLAALIIAVLGYFFDIRGPNANSPTIYHMVQVAPPRLDWV